MSLGDTTLTEAWSWVGPLFGTGALTAIVVAWLGRKAATRPDTTTSSLGIGAILADHMSIDRLSLEMKRVADSMDKVAGGINRYCDLMDITQALERLHLDRMRDERSK